MVRSLFIVLYCRGCDEATVTANRSQGLGLDLTSEMRHFFLFFFNWLPHYYHSIIIKPIVSRLYSRAHIIRAKSEARLHRIFSS